MTKLVGLVGFAQAGKDTVAKVLIEEHGFARVALADALREMLYALNPKVRVDLMSNLNSLGLDAAVQRHFVPLRALVDAVGWDEAKKESEVRALLQRLGTEAGRNVLGEDVWVDAAFRKVDALLRRGSFTTPALQGYDYDVPGVVLTDVRFPNEALRVSDEGGEMWYVRRPGVEAVNDHMSERLAEEMEDWYDLNPSGSSPESPYHRVIENDGDVADLYHRVRVLARDAGISPSRGTSQP